MIARIKMYTWSIFGALDVFWKKKALEGKFENVDAYKETRILCKN
jgi:hypothetical protein